MINEEWLNKIYKYDCIEGMNRLYEKTGGVDLVVTDPPYGINFNSNRSKDKKYRDNLKSVDGIANDGIDNLDFLNEVASVSYKLLKDNSHMYWFTRWDKVEEQKPMLEKIGFKVKNNIIWVKNNWSMGDLKGAYAGQYECILFCHKGRKELNTYQDKSRHPDVVFYDRIPPNKLLHSHQKPVELLEFLIHKSSNENDIVLDPFMGSGSTAEACIKTKRKYIGFELDENHYNVAIERLENLHSKTS